MGDMNLCAKKWDDPGYHYIELSNLVKDFLIEENCHQIVDDFTRVRKVNGQLQRSSLDHITVNYIEKINNLQILDVGQIDHLGLFITKYSREMRLKLKKDV